MRDVIRFAGRPRNALDEQDRFAGFLNHLLFKVKLFVKNETRRRLKLDHESNMLFKLTAAESQPSNNASRQLPYRRHAHFGLGIQRRLCYLCRHIHTNSRPSNGISMKLQILFISLLCSFMDMPLDGRELVWMWRHR